MVSAGSVVWATSMLTLDLPTLVARADQVVLAHVVSTASHFTADHGTIYTDVVLAVTRSYKGAAQPGQTLTVQREGGSVGGIAAQVAGAPLFVVGEDAVVFVSSQAGRNVVVGMAQGKLTVTVVAGQKFVAANLSGLDLVSGGKPIGRRTLDDLERAIAIEVRHAAKPPSAH
jgi:hypothetical protein